MGGAVGVQLDFSRNLDRGPQLLLFYAIKSNASLGKGFRRESDVAGRSGFLVVFFMAAVVLVLALLSAAKCQEPDAHGNTASPPSKCSNHGVLTAVETAWECGK